MDKLELKHLAPYLPYELPCKVTGSQRSNILMAKENYEYRDKYRKDLVYTLHGLTGNMASFKEGLDPNAIHLSPVYLEYVKPILRPLSDLTKEIEHNGEKFVPIIKMVAECHYWMDYYNQGKFGEDIKSRPYKPIYNVGYGDMKFYWTINCSYIPALDFQYIQKLFEWHFDVFGLIEKDLAVDINTLIKTP